MGANVVTSLCELSVLEDKTLFVGLSLGSHSALLRFCLACDLMILALLSNAVQANTFTKAITIELLVLSGFVNVASRAL